MQLLASKMLISPRAPGTLATSRMIDEKNEYHQATAPISTATPPAARILPSFLRSIAAPYSAACRCAA